jgi:acetoin utilization protein AcuB
MLVAERMSREPITISRDTPVPDALKLMRDRKVRRLPVIDSKGRPIGIVSEKDLLYASPSPATTLSIYEMQYLLSKIPVSEVMTSRLITVTDGATLEEAARLMIDNQIGGLPVVHGEKLVGIITETDIFKAFLELLGGWEHGIRLTILVPDEKGLLCRLTEQIANLDGNIISLGTFLGDRPDNRKITLKVTGMDQDILVKTVQPIALEIIDVRST